MTEKLAAAVGFECESYSLLLHANYSLVYPVCEEQDAGDGPHGRRKRGSTKRRFMDVVYEGMQVVRFNRRQVKVEMGGLLW